MRHKVTRTRPLLATLIIVVATGCYSQAELARRCRASCNKQGMEMGGISTIQPTNPFQGGWGNASACQCVPRSYTTAPMSTAGCSKDTDCKGDRVCRAGQCMDPLPRETAAPPTPATPGPMTTATATSVSLGTIESIGPAQATMANWVGKNVRCVDASGTLVDGALVGVSSTQVIIRRGGGAESRELLGLAACELAN